MKRRTPQQDRRVKWQREYAQARGEILVTRPRCERRADGCTERPTEVHHKAGRRHPDANAHRNLAALCASCHRHIHANPTESYEHGWLLHYEQAAGDVPRDAA